jgi:hypothetical protein
MRTPQSPFWLLSPKTLNILHLTLNCSTVFLKRRICSLIIGQAIWRNCRCLIHNHVAICSMVTTWCISWVIWVNRQEATSNNQIKRSIWVIKSSKIRLEEYLVGWGWQVITGRILFTEALKNWAWTTFNCLAAGPCHHGNEILHFTKCRNFLLRWVTVNVSKIWLHWAN